MKKEVKNSQSVKLKSVYAIPVSVFMFTRNVVELFIVVDLKIYLYKITLFESY